MTRPRHGPCAVMMHPERLDRVLAFLVEDGHGVVVEERDCLTGEVRARHGVALPDPLAAAVAAVVAGLGLVVPADLERILGALGRAHALARLSPRQHDLLEVLLAVKVALEHARVCEDEFDA